MGQYVDSTRAVIQYSQNIIPVIEISNHLGHRLDKTLRMHGLIPTDSIHFELATRIYGYE